MSGFQPPVPADPAELEAPERGNFRWEEYRGYIKREYDVLTWDGRIYYRCYPNAGVFTARCGEEIKESRIDKVRLAPEPFTRN